MMLSRRVVADHVRMPMWLSLVGQALKLEDGICGAQPGEVAN
jgi:hypothetical protein